MKKLLVFTISVTVLLSSCQQKKKSTVYDYTQPVRDSAAIADSIRQVEAVELAYAIEQLRLDSIALAEEAAILEQESYKYHIIVGSFITPEYAYECSSYYTSMGYYTNIYPAENGFDLVSAMDLDDYSEAQKMLSRFQDTVNYESWIYIYPF